jgi:hypothetical protein
MRGPVPLTDADFAAIRASVLARIETRRRPYGWYFALAASVVVAMLSMIVARQPVVAPPSSAPFAALRGHLLPLTPEKDAVAYQRPSPASAGEGGAKRRVRVAHHRKPHRAPTAVARIELQTADPDVRIIWITN